MELRHLRYFVAVAEELSFTRAAFRLHTAQPSLSQQIRQLEHDVGVALLERTRHQVRLTPAGRQYLQDAREILAHVDRATRRAARAAAGELELAVGTFLAADVKILPRVRPLLAARMPELHLVLHSRYATDVQAGLRQGRLDVIFERGPLFDNDFAVTELARESIVAVVPASHRSAKRRSISLASLGDLACIPTSRAVSIVLHDTVLAFCQKHRLRVHPVHQADNTVGHLSLVGAGLGFALLPDYVAALALPDVAVRPITGVAMPSVSIVMVRRREPATPTLQAFLDLVRDAMQGQTRDV